jgi:hypothetical protein
MTVTFEEYNKLIISNQSARFVKSNLHLHTPATSWDWNSFTGQTKSASDISPETYFKELNKTSLDIIAVTDHNCITWCEPLMELAKEGRKQGISKVHILPGVEITTYEGPHLIAVFEEDVEILPEIKKMLIRLGMSGDGLQEDRVALNSTSEIPISKVFDEIVRLNGLIIGPHVHQKDGLWGPKEFRGRREILNDKRLRILAAPSGDIKRVIDQKSGKVRFLYKNMDSDKIENSFAFLNISDCHRLDDLDLNSTWIKMSVVSLDGVRQIIYEPELRISQRVIKSSLKVENPYVVEFIEPEDIRHPFIVGMVIDNGLLGGQCVSLSPHQNSIIGKNYAGKSTLLDCLRFALGAFPPNESEDHYKFSSRLQGLLGEGGQVRVYLCGKDRVIHAVSRIFSSTKVRKDKYKIEGEPRIYTLWDNEFRADTDLSVNDIFSLEVYPQGEVVRIKDNVSEQMKIVDSLAGVEQRIKQLMFVEMDGKHTMLGDLAENSSGIIQVSNLTEKLEDEIKGIDDLTKEIKSLEKLAKSPLLAEAEDWNNAKSAIEQAQEELQNNLKKIESLQLPEGKSIAESINNAKDNGEVSKSQTNKTFNPNTSTSDEYKTEVARLLNEGLSQLRNFLNAAEQALNSAITQLNVLDESRQARWKEISKKIYKEMASRGLEPHSELVERISEKRARLSKLINKRAEIVGYRKQKESLESGRNELLKAYKHDWEEIRALRREVVNLINRSAAENVKADLIESSDVSQYRLLLEQIADGLTSSTNKIQNKTAQLDLIAEFITPEKLIEIVKSNDANRLIELVPSVTENTARILLGMGLADIHKLETCILQDRFLIKLLREGETTYTPIDAGLSGGEQALALISVAMIEKDMPLVIDQPEDELGPALITKELVDQIRAVKPKRQLLFVTHIANIPVLADSEQVLYLQQETNLTGNKISVIKHIGSLDKRDIVSCLLELDGGKVAFQKRSERYSCVMG